MKQIVDPYYDKLVEDEFYSAIENRDRKIEENKRLIAEKEKIIAQQNTILAQINEKKKQLNSVIKQMQDNGVDEKLIIQAIGLQKYNSLKN